jgi:hypothetical protein
MGLQNKDFPIRYSLVPEERKKVAAALKKTGGATPTQIGQIARKQGVARKCIVELINTLHLEVLPDKKPVKKTNKRPTAKQVAEKHFKEPVSAPTPEPTPIPEKQFDATLEKTLKDEGEQTLEYLASVEEELRLAKERAAAAEERAREEIRKTAELRKATRGHRDTIEELRGDLGTAQRKAAKATAQANSVTAELKEAIKREKALLTALNESERAYDSLAERCRS